MADSNDFAAPGGPNDRVFISSRLLAQLISGELFRNGQDGCETHELLLVPSQSGKESRDSTMEVISCICRKCRFHFRISVNTTIDAPGGLPDQHQPRTHMFLLYNRDSNMTLEATRSSGDFVLDRLHLSCIADKCNYKMVLERLPPRISAQEVEAMQDKKRVARNFEVARAEHRDRFKDLESWVPDLFAMLQRYSKDCIETKSGDSPKKIKRHNKKFLVAFKDDFDPLLRSLGCTLKVIDDGDEGWVFPVLEEPSSPTMCGTLRAKWEDVEAECMVLMELMSGPNSSAAATAGVRKVRPAWDMLQRAFACEKNESAIGYPSVNEADMALLGCLPYYKPMAIFEAARLLADRFPRRALEFTQAARRSIGDRDSLASSDLAMFESNIVNVADMERLEGALNFFSGRLSQKDADYYVTRYYEFINKDDSSSLKARALEYITIVGKYLNSDLRDFVSPQGQDTSTNKMNLTKAQAILGDSVPSWGEHLLLEIVNKKMQDAAVDNAQVAEALEVYAEHTRSSNAGLAARFEEMSGFCRPYVQNATDSYPPAVRESLDPNTPPGLGNIGNTCYLNSLLQYLYSVVPVRNLVLRYPEQSLDLNSETAIGQRILPIANGLRVSREEAIVGRQFVESLQVLFQSLRSTTDVSCTPSQRLANTALRSASTLLAQMTGMAKNENTAPPLPAHSSPVSAETTSSETNKISVTVEPINDPVETASDVSSQTLVNDDSAMSIDKFNGHGETPPGMHQPIADSATVGAETSATASTGISNLDTVNNTISQFLEMSDRQGTDQQDVEEIIGFILEHIMRAISSTGLMADQLDLQADAITDTFFPLFINSVLDMKDMEKKPGVELVPDRWINVLPDAKKGVSSTIHEALTRFFTLQMLERNKDQGPRAQYSALRKLAPIMHIRIGRATSDNRNRVTKNENPVLLVDELYLDRYMDASQDSELYRMRLLDWTMRAHRQKLDEVDGAAQEIPVSEEERRTSSTHETEDSMAVDHDCALESDEEPVERVLRSIPFDSDGTKKRKINPNDDLVCSSAHIMPALTKALAAMAESRVENSKPNVTEKKVTSYYESLQEHKYRLHSVICHSGGASAGHYWVWIRDFERNRWLKYNDSTVTVDNRDPQAVIDDLNKSGDPCYVAYVRDRDKSDLVGIPQRNPIVWKETPSQIPTILQGVDPGTDTDMTDSQTDTFTDTGGSPRAVGKASTTYRRLSDKIF